MDLERMQPLDRVALCKKYFYFGFLLLPFLWLVNTIWFGLFLYNYPRKMDRQRRELQTYMERELREAMRKDGGGEHHLSASTQPHRGQSPPPPPPPSVSSTSGRPQQGATSLGSSAGPSSRRQSDQSVVTTGDVRVRTVRVDVDGNGRSSTRATDSRQPAQQPSSTRSAASSRHQPPPPPISEEQEKVYLQQIRWYVILSAIGVAIWGVIIIVWVTVFQLKRAAWGEFGDSISFNIPRGRP